MTKLKKNSNCDKTQTFKLWQNSKTQIVTELKKNKLWQNTKTQIVTKFKNSKWKEINSNCEREKKKTQIAKKLKNSSCDKNQKL